MGKSRKNTVEIAGELWHDQSGQRRSHFSSLPIFKRQEKAQQEAAAKEPEGSGVRGLHGGIPVSIRYRYTFPNLFQFCQGNHEIHRIWGCHCSFKTSKVQVGAAPCHQGDGASIRVHVHIDMHCSYTHMTHMTILTLIIIDIHYARVTRCNCEGELDSLADQNLFLHFSDRS